MLRISDRIRIRGKETMNSLLVILQDAQTFCSKWKMFKHIIKEMMMKKHTIIISKFHKVTI